MTSFISKLLNDSIVRSQDLTSLIETIALNNIGKLLAWNYIVENWNLLFQR